MVDTRKGSAKTSKAAASTSKKKSPAKKANLTATAKKTLTLMKGGKKNRAAPQEEEDDDRVEEDDDVNANDEEEVEEEDEVVEVPPPKSKGKGKAQGKATAKGKGKRPARTDNGEGPSKKKARKASTPDASSGSESEGDGWAYGLNATLEELDARRADTWHDIRLMFDRNDRRGIVYRAHRLLLVHGSTFFRDELPRPSRKASGRPTYVLPAQLDDGQRIPAMSLAMDYLHDNTLESEDVDHLPLWPTILLKCMHIGRYIGADSMVTDATFVFETFFAEELKKQNLSPTRFLALMENVIPYLFGTELNRRFLPRAGWELSDDEEHNLRLRGVVVRFAVLRSPILFTLVDESRSNAAIDRHLARWLALVRLHKQFNALFHACVNNEFILDCIDIPAPIKATASQAIEGVPGTEEQQQQEEGEEEAEADVEQEDEEEEEEDA